MFLIICELLGKMKGLPSQPQQGVCVGPSTTSRYRDRVNISWDPLPCHLQNGFDVSYIIQYTNLSTGVETNISTERRQLCRQEPGGPYSCLLAASLFIPDVTYSFKVAAQSVRGVGPFSDPVDYTVTGSQGK